MERWIGEKRERKRDSIQSERETRRELAGVGGGRKAGNRRGEEGATEENRRETGSSVRLVPAHTSHPILRSLSPSILPYPPPRTAVPRALEMKPNFSLLPRLTLLATLQPLTTLLPPPVSTAPARLHRALPLPPRPSLFAIPYVGE